jgi:hypothetical protein
MLLAISNICTAGAKLSFIIMLWFCKKSKIFLFVIFHDLLGENIKNRIHLDTHQSFEDF